MFTAYPTYNPYRGLRLTEPRIAGEDVYALQLALNHVGQFKVPLTADGALGPKTSKAIEGVQRKLNLVIDGVAGPGTQRVLALRIGKEAKMETGLPPGLPGGQIAHESSFLLGNYSARRPDGSYDAGVVQRNTRYHNPEDAFDPVASIRLLCGFVADRHELYEAAGHVDERRAWELAAGAWNAPYYANWLAGVEPSAKPGPSALEALEAYIASATAYLRI